MRKFTILLFTTLIIANMHGILFAAGFMGESFVNSQNDDADSENAAIKSAVEDFYIKGLKTRDFDLIRTVCVPEAKLMGARQNGELGVTTLDQWSARFDLANPPFQKLDYEIVKIDRVGTAAQVRIDFIVDSKTHVTDFLHMLKIKGSWRVVNIIDY